MITLQNQSFPAPSSLSVRVSPQGGTVQYNTLGNLVQDGVREKRTVEILWARLPLNDLTRLGQILTGGFFSCTYPDPLLGSRTMQCRCASHSARVFRCEAGTPLWADVTLALEEQ